MSAVSGVPKAGAVIFLYGAGDDPSALTTRNRMSAVTHVPDEKSRGLSWHIAAWLCAGSPLPIGSTLKLSLPPKLQPTP